MRLLPKWALLNPPSVIYDLESLTPLQQTARVYGAMNDMIREYNTFADGINKEITEFVGSSETEIANFKEAVEQRIRCKFEDMDATFAKIKTDLVTYTNDYLAKVPALPTVDAHDNEKVVQVINGAWKAVQLVDKSLSRSGMAADAAEVGVLKARVNTLAANTGSPTEGNAELIDIRVGYDGTQYPTAGDAVRGQFGTFRSEVAPVKTGNLLNKGTFEEGKYYNGETACDFPNYNLAKVVLPAGSYTIYPRARFVWNRTAHTNFPDSEVDDGMPFTFETDAEAEWWISYYAGDGAKLFIEGEDPAAIPAYGAVMLREDVQIPGYFKENNLLSGCPWTMGAYFTYPDGHVQFERYNYVKVVLPAGGYTVYPRARFVCNGTAGTQLPDSEVDTGTPFTFETDAGAEWIITYYAGDEEKLFIAGTDPETVAPMGMVVLAPNVYIPKSSNNGNILSGKTWVACGDSFTAAGYGGNEGIPESEYIFQDGKYAGKQITYPYIIGLRNDMIIHNIAQGGMTMGNSNPGNSFAGDERYKTIPANADYITLWFGINDDNFSTPVGTIDDEGISTFYGSWNTVMRYLITNHPYAKIGVVITNGSAPKYTEAERAICHKWGIPYLDLEKDPSVPLMLRVNEREGLCEEAKQLRRAAFGVNETNGHPNTAAQYYQSTFIENWLRTL